MRKVISSAQSDLNSIDYHKNYISPARGIYVLDADTSGSRSWGGGFLEAVEK